MRDKACGVFVEHRGVQRKHHEPCLTFIYIFFLFIVSKLVHDLKMAEHGRNM